MIKFWFFRLNNIFLDIIIYSGFCVKEMRLIMFDNDYGK